MSSFLILPTFHSYFDMDQRFSPDFTYFPYIKAPTSSTHQPFTHSSRNLLTVRENRSQFEKIAHSLRKSLTVWEYFSQFRKLPHSLERLLTVFSLFYIKNGVSTIDNIK